MNLYADTSALLKLFLPEPGSEEMRRLYETADRIACASIGYVEIHAGLAMARRTGRLTEMQYSRQLAEVSSTWPSIAQLPVERLLSIAADYASRYALRAYDALHLAALDAFAAPVEATFVCWDNDLRDAAARLGYELLPLSL